jgi:hypothetical protein
MKSSPQHGLGDELQALRQEIAERKGGDYIGGHRRFTQSRKIESHDLPARAKPAFGARWRSRNRNLSHARRNLANARQHLAA